MDIGYEKECLLLRKNSVYIEKWKILLYREYVYSMQAFNSYTSRPDVCRCLVVLTPQFSAGIKFWHCITYVCVTVFRIKRILNIPFEAVRNVYG